MKKYIPYIVVTILLMLITGGVTYILTSKNFENKEANINFDKVETKDNTKIILTDDEIQKYLNYIPKSFGTSKDDRNTGDAYSRATIKVNELTDNELVSMAAYNLAGEAINLEVTYINKEIIKEYVQKMYNRNISKIEIKEDEEPFFIDDYICLMNADTAISINQCNSWWGELLSSVETYEVSSDFLIIYEYAAMNLPHGFPDETECDPMTIQDYHSNYKFEFPYSKTKDGYCSYETTYNGKDAQEYFKEHRTDFTKYKHTFKKNDTGYYWYSTEVVSEGTKR